MDKSTLATTELRRRAEKVAASTDLPSKADLDPIRMLHELQVHQIELELQNEDLLAANRELDGLRRKYQALYELAPVGYLSLSLHGEIVEMNARAEAMLGRERSSIVNRRLSELFANDAEAALDNLIRSAVDSGSEASADNLLLPRPHGVPIFVRAQARTMQAPDQAAPLVLMAMMDVSRLKFAVDDVLSVLKE